jgi:hypothetical protein
MRSAMAVVVFICFLFLMVLIGPFVGIIRAQCTDPIRSPTYGKPASKFVSGCEIYLFGEYLEPVEGPDGAMGFLIEKTDSAVTINGRHFFSPYDPQRTPVRPPSERVERQSAVIMEAEAEIRRLAHPHPTREKAYFIDSVLYTDEPKPYVTASGDTVMLQFHKESARIVYEDVPLVFELNPYRGPFMTEAERNELYLDNAYDGLAAIRPGFIILIGRGYKNWYPLSVASDLKAVLIKIPELARRRYENIYGEWVYESITIDGYFFSPTVVADFALK